MGGDTEPQVFEKRVTIWQASDFDSAMDRRN